MKGLPSYSPPRIGGIRGGLEYIKEGNSLLYLQKPKEVFIHFAYLLNTLPLSSRVSGD